MKPTLQQPEASLIVATFFPSITSTESKAHFDELGDLVMDLERAAVVVDLSKADIFSATLRREGAQHMQGLYQRVGGRLVGVAHVAPAPLVRGMLTAVQWLAPPPFPTVTISTVTKGLSWGREMLSKCARIP